MIRSPRSATARLAVAVIVLLALGACSDDATPGPVVRSEAGSRPGTAPLGTPSATPTLPGADDPTPEPTDSVPTTSETPSPASTSTPPELEPELVVYAREGVEAPFVTSSLDVGRLRGAPADFKDFIGELADTTLEESTCTEAGAVGITVDVVRTDGYAAGGVNDCGGYAALWAKDEGDWVLIQATQESWNCAILELYRVPSDVLLDTDTCFDYDGDNKEHAYSQA